MGTVCLSENLLPTASTRKLNGFTKALVEGLSGEGDSTKDGSITINELNLFLTEWVKKLTGGSQSPTVTIPKTVFDFPLATK